MTTTQQPNPFLTKIIFEPQLVENENFSVVTDIDPIVDGHYLFYSKKWLPSIADCDTAQASAFLHNLFARAVDVPYAYFERGRASFCTSMNGVLHAHGHLVPVFSANMAQLFPYGTIERCSDLEEAYRLVETQGQYLLWGNLGGDFYVIQNVEELPKRTIRNTIRARQHL
ncbi:hypothetical protein N510_000673 [Firmicutes bacterium ASF500]|nr:hypothetical protein N510_000673 [Firmicutes bacterium ASF500]